MLPAFEHRLLHREHAPVQQLGRRADLSGTLRGTVGPFQYLADAGRRSTELAPGMAETQGALAERWDGLFKLG